MSIYKDEEGGSILEALLALKTALLNQSPYADLLSAANAINSKSNVIFRAMHYARFGVHVRKEVAETLAGP